MPFFFFSQLHILDFYPEGMANLASCTLILKFMKLFSVADILVTHF